MVFYFHSKKRILYLERSENIVFLNFIIFQGDFYIKIFIQEKYTFFEKIANSKVNYPLFYDFCK